jgi:hypothetical protein
MAHRVNVLLDDAVWRVLEKAPRGERSGIVNAALTRWFETRVRRTAARRMDELRADLPAVETQDVVAWLREDRGRAG